MMTWTKQALKEHLDALPEGQTVRISDSGLYASKSNGQYSLAVGGVFGHLELRQRYLDAPDVAIELLERQPMRFSG